MKPTTRIPLCFAFYLLAGCSCPPATPSYTGTGTHQLDGLCDEPKPTSDHEVCDDPQSLGEPLEAK
jgi:hypothetical protein